MYQSDVFVLYDNVQFDKHGWRNRNRIKTPHGIHWLSVPVMTRGHGGELIRDVLIDNGRNWNRKHLQSIRQSYTKAPFHTDYMALFESVLNRKWKYLLDLNVAFLDELQNALGLQREVIIASDLDIQGERIERLISICRAVGADVFFEGEAGRNYIDDSQFFNAGVQIEYQQYQHPEYPQLHGEFVPFLSVVDLLFNCGPHSLEILVQ